MKKIGITGQVGFVGSHLYNYFSLFKEKYTIITFEDSYFDDRSKLNNFVKQCDVIVHLAGVNRDPDPKVVYDANIQLATELIDSMMFTKSTPHVLFSSSTQEENDNHYGNGKRKARELFVNWAETNNALFTGLIIPNVYGPFGKPFYNSVIATFCHQLTHGENPQVNVDAILKLIYVQELVFEIEKIINSKITDDAYRVPFTAEKKVTVVLQKLHEYKEKYFENGIIPEFSDAFELNLFNTFRCFIDYQQYFPRKYKVNTDNRGCFVELIKLEQGGQVSFSTTVPGVTRGNHFHTRKIERFSVIKGEALIRLRRIGTNEVCDFHLSGTQPGYVDMPVWNTHNIKNIGNQELVTIFWINEFFDPNNPDTYFEEV